MSQATHQATPTSRSAAVAAARDFWRTFFSGPVRDNVVRGRGGGVPGATTAIVGLLAFAVAALAVLAGPNLAALPTLPGEATLGSDTRPGHPVSIPVLAFPVLTGLLVVSVFAGVFGAAYARTWLAIAASILVTLPTILIAGDAWVFRELAWQGWVSLPAAALLTPAIWLLRRFRPPPTIVQPMAAALAVLAVVPAAIGLTTAYTQPGLSGGVALLGQGLERTLTLLALVVAPVAILAGAGAVSFTRTVTGFLTRTLARALPFAPILGFTGVGLVFFGVIWGFVTSGGHAAATGLAGLGRTTILIAYAVLTTTLVAWGSITGSDIAGSASGTFADAGSNILGTTLLTCFLAVWLDRLTNPAELTNPADVTDPAEVSQPSRPRPQGGYRLGHPVRP